MIDNIKFDSVTFGGITFGSITFGSIVFWLYFIVVLKLCVSLTKLSYILYVIVCSRTAGKGE